MKMIRTFLAVKLSSEIRESIASLQQQLKSTLPPINWVRPESIHLTLKFLGYVEASRVAELVAALEPIGKKQPSFSIDVQGLGVFPQVKFPRILWIGVTGERQVLQDLVFEIEVALEPLGFPVEKKSYHPHLTLARIKRENAAVGAVLTKNNVLKCEPQLGTLIVDRFILFQSDLDSSGATYTPLVTVKLTGILPDQ